MVCERSIGSDPAGAGLVALRAAVERSPIIVWPAARRFDPRDWARIRKSRDVDAFVLAWIASHVHRARRAYM